MSTIAAGTTSGTALVTSGDTTGQLVLQTNGTTTAVTIGTNQVVSLAQPLPVASGGTGSTTGLNLATSATGTLPVANGGTGRATLTANNVLLGNGTTAVNFVAPGTNGNVLTSNGTTWASSAAPTSGWVFINSVTASASSTVDITSGLTSTYSQYVIVASDVVQTSTSSSNLVMEFQLGGSWSATNYNATYFSPSGLVFANTTAATGYITGTMGAGSGQPRFNFMAYISAPTVSKYQVVNVYGGQTTGYNSSGYPIISGIGNTTTGTLTGVRFSIGATTIASGTFRLYGIKNS